VRRSEGARRTITWRAIAETRRRHTINILLWVLQGLAALLYTSSGVMKVFMFDKVSHDVPSFGALPRNAWTLLGIVELVCTVGIIVPDALHWHPQLTILAAVVLAVESLVFIWVHVKYREVSTIIMSAVLGILMAFIAYGRLVLHPIM
jgi:DoxX-like protein